MAPRKDRRARSRKRRAGSARPDPSAPAAVATRPAGEPDGAQRRWRGAVQDARVAPAGRRRASARRERPAPPWHPLPVSEILILAGSVAFIIGLRRGPATAGRPVLLLGVLAVLAGTIEVTWREHRSGFRSHTVLLALLPVVMFHTLVVLLVSALAHVTRTLNIGVVVIDVAIFAVLLRLLRAQYTQARQRQLSGASRRGHR